MGFKIGMHSVQWAREDDETTLFALALFAALALLVAYVTKSVNLPGLGLPPYLKFVYANFLKPQNAKTSSGQQSALESFYAAQVGQLVSRLLPFQLKDIRPVSTI